MESRIATSTANLKRRSTAQPVTESPKRRASYVLRACNACKRRKGRCDGRQPCQHCQKRSIECHYATHPQLDLEEAGNSSILTADDGHEGTSRLEYAASSPSLWQDEKEKAVADKFIYSNENSLKALIENLQRQLDEVITEIKQQRVDLSNPPALPSPSRQQHQAENEYFAAPSIASISVLKSNIKKPKHAMSRFHGSSSSEYSLNLALMKLCQTEVLDESPTVSTANFGEPTTDNELNLNLPEDITNVSCYSSDRSSCDITSQIPRLLSKSEVLGLLRVYQEVVGELHPILDSESLVDQVESLFMARDVELGFASGNAAMPIDEEDVHILSIVCSIALLAKTSGKSRIGRALYHSVQGEVQTQTMSRVTNTRSVVLILLASVYQYFNDEIWLAWRFCGIAGRMAMELGLHSWDTFQSIFRTQRQRNEASSILWSIIVLDRQWSCSLGLPQNFQDSDFDKRLPVPENSPYLKAMMSYGLFSSKHWDSTHRTIAGGTSEYDDSYDFLNFQVEQWRKKALKELDFVHPKDRESLGIMRLPESLPTLLYLRANQLQGLLLQPFFTSNSNLAASGRLANQGLELAFDTILILSDINKTTDVYKKQLPIFRHFLASSVALILLIITHELQNDSSSTFDHLPQRIPSYVNEAITMAVDLAADYANSSHVSLRLLTRLLSMRESFSSLEIITSKQLRQQAFHSSSIPYQNVRNTIPNGIASDNASSSELVQNSMIESCLTSYPSADNQFGISFATEEICNGMENSESYLAAGFNIGTLDGQEWCSDNWVLDEMDSLS